MIIYVNLPELNFLSKINFSRQSLKIFTVRVKLSDSIFFLLGLSPIVKLIWHEKQFFLILLRGKYCLIHLEIVKRPNKWNYNVEILFKTRYCCPHPTPTQLYLVWIRFRRKISFDTSFTISKWLKKYYSFFMQCYSDNLGRMKNYDFIYLCLYSHSDTPHPTSPLILYLQKYYFEYCKINVHR